MVGCIGATNPPSTLVGSQPGACSAPDQMLVSINTVSMPASSALASTFLLISAASSSICSVVIQTSPAALITAVLLPGARSTSVVNRASSSSINAVGGEARTI